MQVLTHSGTQITTSAQSSFAISALRVGDTVTVSGTMQADGTMLADEIETEGNEVELRGVIDSVTPPTLTVGGRVVVTDSTTEFDADEHDSRFTLADLHAGDTVKVEGTLQPDSSVLAREIEVRHGEAGEQENDQAEVEGVIDSLLPPDLFVAGQLVHTDSATVIRHDGDTLTLGDLHAGERVKARGVRLTDGSLQAREIEPDN